MTATSYTTYFWKLRLHHSREEALRIAVGTRGSEEEFTQKGLVERAILTEAGLRPDHYLIDVGCGSGRLASVLDEDQRYMGTDVVRGLLKACRKIRPGWRFELVKDIVIPEQNERADMVSFFSVFTHLLHEDSYRYLLEANRVLRDGGRVVFTFLEFTEQNWPLFANMAKRRTKTRFKPHNQFISRDGIEVWAEHSGFKVVKILGALEKQISSPIDGMDKHGQSLCVLEKIR